MPERLRGRLLVPTMTWLSEQRGWQLCIFALRLRGAVIYLSPPERVETWQCGPSCYLSCGHGPPETPYCLAVRCLVLQNVLVPVGESETQRKSPHLVLGFILEDHPWESSCCSRGPAHVCGHEGEGCECFLASACCLTARLSFSLVVPGLQVFTYHQSG